MRNTFIIFFLLGMFTYGFIPKDVAVPNPSVEPQNAVTQEIVDGNRCIIDQEGHMIGSNFMPLQKVVCTK